MEGLLVSDDCWLTAHQLEAKGFDLIIDESLECFCGETQRRGLLVCFSEGLPIQHQGNIFEDLLELAQFIVDMSDGS